jgi:metal-sulfur cluster biosynthetic enzyme
MPDTDDPSLGNEPVPATTTSDATEEISEDQVRLALRRVKDPEINLNIVDLGLIYEISVSGRDVTVDMSLTSPGCPAGPQILQDVEEQLRAIPGIGGTAVNIVWSPPWTPDRIEPRVRAYLGF